MSPPISMGSDGYYHPSTEAELAALVKWAHDTNRQVRVRGSTHTFPHRAIFTDRDPGKVRLEINIMLDRYRAVRWVDEVQGIVEVEAGCNLSINPYDPTGTSTVENGLLYQLQQKGWALSDLGGISHQTVSGFLATGSSGGSLKFGIDENILKLRLIDGTGQIHEVSRDQDPDLFHAAGVSMGLLGVISSVTFQCVPTYNIKGSESTTAAHDCEIDLFGPGTDDKPSFEQFLRETDYSRLMWWPQRGLDRMVVWKARRIPASPGFVPKPYEEMGRYPEGSEVLAGLLLSILGNLDDLRLLPQKVEPIFSQLDATLLEDIEKMGFEPRVAEALSTVVAALLEAGVDGLLEFPGIELAGRLLKEALPSIVPVIYKEFVPLDGEKQPPGPQEFCDYWWTGLPMDNGMDDILMPTWFTEIWIPVSKTQAVMTTLRDFFATGGLKATGTFSFELYGTKASPFWMSASSDGEPVVRVDVFWFGYNAGDPAIDFYPQFWELLKPFGFKLHWGKFLPNDPPPAKVWSKYLAKQFKRWNDFMALRARLDPKNIFLTAYWREHLGLEDAMPKRPVPAPLPKPDPFATEAWASAERAVTLYSWLILVAVVYGLLAAHIPFLIGHPWTTCKPYADPLGCVITFHFWEVPIVLYQIAFAVYGLRGLKAHAARYASLVAFTAALLAIFALFEVLLILDSFQRGAPAWEIAALFSVATMLMAGVALGLYTRLKLASALSPKR
ncbi:FAD-binding protein [Sorangium sp. So ce185]|uniref:FAD-binding protein n=1 Tax=Sorangium sp. So ce185 TaxID=3133287 RepID=UPI003F5E8F77